MLLSSCQQGVPMFNFKALAGLWVAACLSTHASLEAQTVTPAPTLSVADFFRTPQSARPAISPSGRYVAFAMSRDKERVFLAVIDLEGPLQPRAVAALRDNDVGRIAWVNDDRLVFDSYEVGSGNDLRKLAPGLWSVNRDGSEMRQLIRADYVYGTRTGTRLTDERVLDWNWSLHRVVADGSNDVIVRELRYSATGEPVGSSLGRLNTKSARLESISEGAPSRTFGWSVSLKGKPVAAVALREGRYELHGRRADDSGWERWDEGDAVRSTAPQVLAIGPDDELFFVSGSSSGLHTLYRGMPREALSAAKPLLSLDGFDFNGELVQDIQTGRVLGAHFLSDAPGTAWFDEGMKAIQQAVDARLPNSANTLICSRCEAAPRILVRASSDQQPELYYVYHREKQQLTPLFASRPWLLSKKMAQRDVQRFKARDGLVIPAALTLPSGNPKQPRPAVVLVHGGPASRSAIWTWSEIPQFLASRGYVVIEPDFRGSTGYGWNHYSAGWKQWGLAMQDDVADAVQWAVSQGWVDPKRVCIAGASYGGYAALMGLVKHHDQYACAISWVGVTDIQLMYSIHWSDISHEARTHGMPVLIGDPVKDAAQLRDTSPVHQADKVRRPVLLAYGGDDQRVPIQHGTAFKDALARRNSQVEWVVYPREGHGWRELETNLDFWARVEKFLARHIGHAATSP
jgi:dipeptidyl aminopeptidase/acylaminoacyl peptidase